jgi:hypothetical protein
MLVKGKVRAAECVTISESLKPIQGNAPTPDATEFPIASLTATFHEPADIADIDGAIDDALSCPDRKLCAYQRLLALPSV